MGYVELQPLHDGESMLSKDSAKVSRLRGEIYPMDEEVLPGVSLDPEPAGRCVGVQVMVLVAIAQLMDVVVHRNRLGLGKHCRVVLGEGQSFIHEDVRGVLQLLNQQWLGR